MVVGARGEEDGGGWVILLCCVGICLLVFE